MGIGACYTAGVEDGFFKQYEVADEKNVVEYLAFSTDNPDLDPQLHRDRPRSTRARCARR